MNKHMGATPQLAISCIFRAAPFCFKWGIFIVISRHLTGDLIWICSWVGRAQTRSDAATRSVGQGLSLPVLLSMGGITQACTTSQWCCQHWRHPWPKSTRCREPHGTVLSLPDYHASCISGKPEIPCAAVGAKAVGWNLLIVSKARIWSFAEWLSPCGGGRRGQLVCGKSWREKGAPFPDPNSPALAPRCDCKLAGIKGLFLDLVKLKTILFKYMCIILSAVSWALHFLCKIYN